MSKTYVLEICLELGLTNRVIFDNKEQAEKELNKLKEKMGTRYGKNAEELVEISGPAEKIFIVAGRVQTAAVIDRFEHEKIQQDTSNELASMHNDSWIEQTRKIINAGLGEYIKK